VTIRRVAPSAADPSAARRGGRAPGAAPAGDGAAAGRAGARCAWRGVRRHSSSPPACATFPTGRAAASAATRASDASATGTTRTTRSRRPSRLRVARERERLLAALDSAAALAPDDPVDRRAAGALSRRGGRAQRVAAATVPRPPGVCAALAGSPRMPPATAGCDSASTTPSPASRPPNAAAGPISRPARRAAPCSLRARSVRDRDSLERRIWWLAEPLYAHPATSVRAEHFARLTMARLQQATRSPLDPAWGDDLHELLVRYGWPTAYTRDRMREGTALGAGAKPRVSGHEPRPSYHFFPALARGRAPRRRARRRLGPHRARPPRPATPPACAWRRCDTRARGSAAGTPRSSWPPTTPPPTPRSRAPAWSPRSCSGEDERTAPVVARAARTPARRPWRAESAHGCSLPRRPGAPRSWRSRCSPATAPPPTPRVRATASPSRRPRRRSPLRHPALRPRRHAPHLARRRAPRDAHQRPRAGRGERLGLLWEIYGLADSTEAVTVSLGTERVGAPRSPAAPPRRSACAGGHGRAAALGHARRRYRWAWPLARSPCDSRSCRRVATGSPWPCAPPAVIPRPPRARSSSGADPLAAARRGDARSGRLVPGLVAASCALLRTFTRSLAMTTPTATDRPTSDRRRRSRDSHVRRPDERAGHHAPRARARARRTHRVAPARAVDDARPARDARRRGARLHLMLLDKEEVDLAKGSLSAPTLPPRRRSSPSSTRTRRRCRRRVAAADAAALGRTWTLRTATT
jgi:hypothetical protein